MTVRKPAVAGSFYPADEAELRKQSRAPTCTGWARDGFRPRKSWSRHRAEGLRLPPRGLRLFRTDSGAQLPRHLSAQEARAGGHRRTKPLRVGERRRDLWGGRMGDASREGSRGPGRFEEDHRADRLRRHRPGGAQEGALDRGPAALPSAPLRRVLQLPAHLARLPGQGHRPRPREGAGRAAQGSGRGGRQRGPRSPPPT